MRTITKILVMSSFLIFIFSHLILLNAFSSIYAIKNAEQTYGDIYTIHPDGSIELVFDNGVPLPLEPAYHLSGSSTMYGSTFFMIARLTNGSDAIVLLEVNFNEEFNQIIDYSISPLPLEKKYYAGLATNGSHFWTLEDGRRADNNYSANYQYLICFSLDKGIISNRTFASIDPLFSYPTGKFERTDLQIRNNTVILLEKFYSSSDNIDSFFNITFYDLLTMERENSFDAYYSLPISTESSYYPVPRSINLDATGILWIEHSQPPPVISFSSWNPSIDFLTSGYSLDFHSAIKTLFADYDNIKTLSDKYFSSHVYTYQNHTYDYLARMDHERIITQNKVIDCYEACYEALSDIQENKIIGFRIYSLQKYSFSFPIFQLSIWGVSILFIIAIITFIFYMYYHKDPVDQQPVLSSSSQKQIGKSESLFQELQDIKNQLHQSLTPQLLQKFKLGLRFFLLMSIGSFLIFLSSLIIPNLNTIYINSLANIISMGALSGMVSGIYLFSKNKVGSSSFQGRESVILILFYLLGNFLLTFCVLIIGFPIPEHKDLLGDLDNYLIPFFLFYLLDIVLQLLLLFGVLRFITYFNNISSDANIEQTHSLIGVPILLLLASVVKFIHLYQFFDQSFLGRTYSWISILNELQSLFTSLYPHLYLLFPLFILLIQIWSGYHIYYFLKQLEKKLPINRVIEKSK